MANPYANAWFPLGGHNPSVTAQSPSACTSTGWVQIQQHAAEQALLQRAGPNGVEPESSAAWAQLQQGEAYIQAQQAQLAQAQAVSGGLQPLRTVHFSTMQDPPSPTRASTDATLRSMELLYDWLAPEQRKMLAVRNYFDVTGGDTGRRYRLYPPAPYNIHRLVKDSEETENKICFVPKDQSLPKGDIWLCQKLALELDERATLEIANHQGDVRYGGYG